MRIGIVIPFYLRGKSHNEAYRIAFRHYAKMGYLVHLCGSEGKLSRQFAEPFLSDNVKYFEVQQFGFCFQSGGDNHIRKKFNDSLQTLPKDLDWFCLVGADDIVSRRFFENLDATDPKGINMAGVDSREKLLIHDLNGESYRCELTYSVEILPGVNAFSRDALAINGCKPYLLKGCETGAERYYKSRGVIIPLSGAVIMVKDSECLNPSEKIKARHRIFELTDNEQTFVNLHL